MQINVQYRQVRWATTANPPGLFDAETNIEYAAKYLRRLACLRQQ